MISERFDEEKSERSRRRTANSSRRRKANSSRKENSERFEEEKSERFEKGEQRTFEKENSERFEKGEQRTVRKEQNCQKTSKSRLRIISDLRGFLKISLLSVRKLFNFFFEKSLLKIPLIDGVIGDNLFR